MLDAMAASNTFSRLLIVNGQPILIKDDLELNPNQNFAPDILQQAIDDVTSAEPISPNINAVGKDSNLITQVDTTERSEYVAVLSNDQSSDSTSTIRLTLEQAAELGLHFTVDNVNESFQPSTDENGDVNPFSHSQFLSNSPNPDTTHTNTSDSVQIDSEMPCSLSQDNVLNKNNDGTSFISSFDPVNSSQNHPLTIVPQIVNGTVTYTLQLCEQPQSHSDTNDFFRIDDSAVITQVGQPMEKEVTLGLNNLSSSSYINSDEKTADSPNNIIRCDEGNIACHTFGIVNSDNVTFLSLTDAIPEGTDVSNIVTNINNVTTQSSKIRNTCGKTIQNLSNNKISTAGSLLKPRLSLTKNGIIINQNLNSGKKKVNEQSNLIKNILTNTTPKLINELPNQNINSTRESTQTNKLEVSPITTYDKEGEPNLSSRNNIRKSLNKVPVDGNKNQNNSEDSAENRLRTSPTIITAHAGDVPEEISAVFSRMPIKIDSNKPLGSNENPIKLLQQGTTFHSMQELTEDHISKIQPIFKENLESKTNGRNTVYNAASNTNIIYRIITPEEVSLRKQEEFPRRRGRPKKARFTIPHTEEVEDGAPTIKKFYPRTRSGRLSRPPKYMVRDYKHIRRVELDDSDGAYSDYQSDHDGEVTPSIEPSSEPVELLPGLVPNRKNNKRNISAGNLCPTCGKVYLGYVKMKRHFDKYPDHGSIEYLDTIRNSNPESEGDQLCLNGGNGLWKKGKRKGKGRTFLFNGDKRTRLKEALDNCSAPDVAEVAGPTVAGVLSLWELLLLRADAVKQDSQVSALYHEIYQLLGKLRKMARRLFRPLDHALPPGTKHVTVQVEDELMTNVLNLPCGVYLASDDDLNLDEEPTAVPFSPEKMSSEESQVTESNSANEQNLQEKSIGVTKPKIHLDEVPEPFLLTSEEMICDSDDRGLVNVDEIVSERLQNFTGRLQSSTVDELMKGLNELDHKDSKIETDDLMDGFSIVSRRAHVSASTEDLMKSLEHFESDLNHSDAPVSLDRDTFDRVSNVDTLDFEVLSREFHSNNR